MNMNVGIKKEGPIEIFYGPFMKKFIKKGGSRIDNNNICFRSVI